MNKCQGCGVSLQTECAEQIGYVKQEGQTLCERCFRIRHYGEYKEVAKTNADFFPILKEVRDSNGLAVLVVDLFQLPKDCSMFQKELSNDLLLVLTKRDLLPRSLHDERLIEHLDLKIKPTDIQIVSAKKNDHLDELMEKIKQFRKDKVYVLGYTNAGKSTLINHILKNYYASDIEITTSPLPSTTLSNLEIELPDFTLIDTPGFLEEGSLLDYVDGAALKKIFPKKELQPITYQVKGTQQIWIDAFAVLEVEDNNVTLFFSNLLNMERYYKPKEIPSSFVKTVISLTPGEEVVILGLGFLKATKKGNLTVWTYEGVSVFSRKGLI